jgi:uncharacterized membrane protein YraQ (UPF0718 family)
LEELTSATQRLIPNLLAVVRQSGFLLLDLLPYVVIGALVGAFLLRRREAVLPQRLLNLPPAALIFCSALLGTVSPLCTIGTVPVVIGLVGCGLPGTAGIAFLTASSLVNPQLLVIAFVTIGPALTIAQWLSGIGIGCTAGFVATLCRRRGVAVLNRRLEVPAGHKESRHRGCAGSAQPAVEPSTLSLFLDQLEHILIFVVVGVVAASVVNVWLPGPLMMRFFGRLGLFDVAAGALLSVPLYVCGGGVLPFLAALMGKGLSPGVVLAFIIAGPATRLQALAAVGAFISKRALVAYLLLIWTWAFVAGTIFKITG